MSVKEEIRSAVSVLVGLDVSQVSYAGNMRTMHFGALRERNGHYIGSYALHIQCPWRLERNGMVVTGFGDCEYAAENRDGSPWDFGEIRGSLQEELMLSMFGDGNSRGAKKRNHKNKVVKSVVGDSCGGLVLNFSGNIRLRVLPCSSRGEEWRFFQPGQEDALHFVVESGRVFLD